MKQITRCLWIALTTAMMISCSPKSEGCVIDGQVADAEAGMIYLKKYVEKAYIDVDSAVVVNGKFKFEGVTEPLVYGLTTLKESKRPQTFFMGNENVKLTLDEVAKTLKVEGSPLNDLYTQNVGSIRAEGFSIDSLIMAHPASPVPAYFLANSLAYQFDLAQLKELRAKFDASLDGTTYIQQLEGIISRLEKVQVGQVAPDFTLPDADGNEVSLSSFRGKYVLIDFWASWCPDCRKENPNIVAAWEKYQDKNFAILGVSLDRAREPWLAAIEKDKLTWTHVSDLKDWSTEPAVTYAVRWIPMSFLLDPQGVILAVGLEGEALHLKLEEVLN